MNINTDRIPSPLRRPELFTAAIILLFFIFLEVGVRDGYINPLIVDQPSVVFNELVASLQTQEMQIDLFTTAQRVAITFFISLFLGTLFSLLFWQYEILRRAYLPLFGAIFATPIPLMYLVFVVLFGRGTAAIVAISVPVGTIPIVLNATDALSTVEEVKIQVAESFNASNLQVLYKVIIPDAAPDIFTGIRIGFSYIIISVTAVEFLLVTNQGLGGYISNAYFRFNTTDMFVGIALVISIVIVAIFILEHLEEAIQR